MLPTRNMVFPRTLSIILRYMNYFSNFLIKYIKLDNTKEFRSHAFEDLCTASGIELTYLVAYEHSQNRLAEAFVRKIQLVARSLLLHANLPSSLWGHTVLHAAALLKIRPTMLNVQTPHELLTGRPPNVDHLRTFRCHVWVPISEPRRLTIGPHQ